MNTSQEIGAIAVALAKAQGKIRNAARDAENPFFKSAYAPLDTVIDCIREHLAANEIAYFQSPKSEANKVTLTTRLVHSSGQWIETDPLEAVAKDAAPQSIGSATTYLRRYSLMCAVGIAARDDDDAEATEGRQHETTQQGNPRPRGQQSNADAKAKVAAAAGRPPPVEAYKHEAFREAVRLHGGDEAKARHFLCTVRGDPKASRPWNEADAEKVRAALTLLAAKSNAAQGGLLPAEEMSQ